MHLRVYEPNDMILAAGTMPKDLLFLISGKIALYQRAPEGEGPKHLNPFIIKSIVGPKK